VQDLQYQLIVVSLLLKRSPLIGAIEERKAKIAEGLAAAEKGQEDMERAAKKAANVLREAKQQSADIVNLELLYAFVLVLVASLVQSALEPLQSFAHLPAWQCPLILQRSH
jgi:hypothetical protein